VVAAFNEFCSPNIEEALEDVCRKGYDTIIIVLHDAHSRRFFTQMWPFNVEDID
jgi:sirohydrochlorin ferrochelatase